MSTKHTPGPWFVGRRSDNGWHTVRVADAGCTHGRVVAETIEADDARLIAEAPAMAAMLERCADWFAGGGTEPAANDIRAILARINGEGR